MKPRHGMDLKKTAQIESFLDELSLSIKKIIFANFPHLSFEDREEIDQDVKLKVLKMAAVGKKIGNFRSYVWRMVYTTALDVIGKRLNAISLDEGSRAPLGAQDAFLDEGSPECLLERKEALRLLEKALDSLPERRKTAVRLHFAGLNLTEIARWTGETENTARHLVYRGLDELKGNMTSRLNGKLATQQIEPKKA